MLKHYLLTEKTRIKLKHPLGKLIIGSPDETMPIVQELIRQNKPTKICVVGDFLSQKAIEYNLKIDLWIFDGKVMRQPVSNYLLPKITSVKTHNPPGTITAESMKVVKGITYDRPQAIFVCGEEDLLTLLVIQYAPLNTLVLYGQPRVGVVAIMVTDKMKFEVNNILNQMSIVEDLESLK